MVDLLRIRRIVVPFRDNGVITRRYGQCLQCEAKRSVYPLYIGGYIIGSCKISRVSIGYRFVLTRGGIQTFCLILYMEDDPVPIAST